jgi:hypothetical protein
MIPVLLRNRVFRRYWSASTVSMFGDQIAGIRASYINICPYGGAA